MGLFYFYRLGSDCEKNYVIVRDGMTSHSSGIARVCGGSSDQVTTNGNVMWVELSSSCSIDKSFKAFWSAVEDSSSSSSTAIGPRVSVEKSPGIRDGGTRDNIRVVDTTGGREDPVPGVSKRKPDEGNDSSSRIRPFVPVKVTESRFGATMISGGEGMIRSPKSSDNAKKYPSDTVKAWILSGPGAGTIRLQFTSFDIESDSHCLYDFVEVRESGLPNGALIGRFCGTTLPKMIESKSQKLWVKFKSDSSTEKSGFSADWKWIEDRGVVTTLRPSLFDGGACGGVYTSERGRIRSPRYPEFYPNNMECVYVIKPPNARRVKLTFKKFDLETDPKCRFDYLEVKLGSTENGTLMGQRLCNKELPDPIISDVGSFWIRFRSDVTSNRKGFTATWEVLDE